MGAETECGVRLHVSQWEEIGAGVSWRGSERHRGASAWGISVGHQREVSAWGISGTECRTTRRGLPTRKRCYEDAMNENESFAQGNGGTI